MYNKYIPKIWTVQGYSHEIWFVINLFIFVAENSPVTETVSTWLWLMERMKLYIPKTLDSKILLNLTLFLSLNLCFSCSGRFGEFDAVKSREQSLHPIHLYLLPSCIYPMFGSGHRTLAAFQCKAWGWGKELSVFGIQD